MSAPQPRTVVVTRPQPQADDWVARLQGQGVPALALPLLRIVRDPVFAAQVQAAWAAQAAEPPQYRLVMFVSPSAVEAFWAERPDAVRWPESVWAGATGPGTVAALLQRGVPTACVAAPAPDAPQFDAETLWSQVLRHHDWTGARVLIVRGESGRDWLATTLQQAGACVDAVAAYRRESPTWSPAEQQCLAQLAAYPQQHAWLFSSSQCLTALTQSPQWATAGDHWQRMPVLATHPRIADTAVRFGFLVVNNVTPDPVTIARKLCTDPLYTIPTAG